MILESQSSPLSIILLYLLNIYCLGVSGLQVCMFNRLGRVGRKVLI